MAKLLRSFFVLTIFVSAFVYSPALPDVDFTLRMIFFGIVSAVFSILILFQILRKKDAINLNFVKHPVVISFGLFVVSFLIGSIKTFDREEADVLKMLLLSVVFFLFLVLLFNPRLLDFHNKNQALEIILKATILSVYVFVFFAMVQLIDNYNKTRGPVSFFRFNYTIYSSHANKNSFIECLLLQMPFVIYGLFNLKRYWKAVAIVALILCLGFIFLSQSASVVVALIMSSVIGTLLYFGQSGYFKKKKIMAVSFLTFIVLAMGIALLNKAVKARFSLVTKYLTDTAAEQSQDKSLNSVYERLMLWNSTWNIIKQNPVKGNGLGSWKILLPAYSEIDPDRFVNYAVKFTRPHNEYLFFWSELGILGLLSFLAIFFFALKYSYKIIKNPAIDGSRKFLGYLLFCGVLSYGLVAITGFPTERIYNFLLLEIYLAIILSIDESTALTLKSKPLIILFAGTLLFSLFAVNFSINRLRSEIALRNTIHWKMKKENGPMLYESNKIDEHYLSFDYTATPVSWYKATACFLNNDIKKALSYYIDAENASPYHIQVLNDLGTCYDKQGEKALAETEYQKAIKLNPSFSESIYNLTALRFNSHQLMNAYRTLKLLPSREKSPRKMQYEKVILTAVADSVLKSTNIENDSLKNKIKDYEWLRNLDSVAAGQKIAFDNLMNTQFHHISDSIRLSK